MFVAWTAESESPATLVEFEFSSLTHGKLLPTWRWSRKVLQKGRSGPREGSDLGPAVLHLPTALQFSPVIQSLQTQILFRSSPSHFPSVQKMSLMQVLCQILEKCFVLKLLMSQMLILHLSHFSLTWCLGEGEMGG